MQDILRFHVPCKKEYTKLVEDFARISAVHLNPNADEEFKGKICVVMNEVFINIVNHSKTADQNEVVRFQFEIGLKYFSISIYDYGPGFMAEGKLPPYPKEFIGKKYKLRDVIDGEVSFSIVDPFSISFVFEKNEDSRDNLQNINDSGLGMSIVTKLMDTVTYSYIGNGKFDWKLYKKFD